MPSPQTPCLKHSVATHLIFGKKPWKGIIRMFLRCNRTVQHVEQENWRKFGIILQPGLYNHNIYKKNVCGEQFSSLEYLIPFVPQIHFMNTGGSIYVVPNLISPKFYFMDKSNDIEFLGRSNGGGMAPALPYLCIYIFLKKIRVGP